MIERPCQRGRKCFVPCPECREPLAPVITAATPQGNDWIFDMFRFDDTIPEDQMLVVQPVPADNATLITGFDLGTGDSKTVKFKHHRHPDGTIEITEIIDD